MDNNDLQRTISKMDAFILQYTEEESKINAYITGKSIADHSERCVSFLSINPDDTQSMEMVLNLPCSIQEKTMIIDYRLLNKKMIDCLKRAYQQGSICGIRIIPDNYRLTKEVYDELDQADFYGFLVSVHSLEDNIKNFSSYLDIRPQQGLCQIEHIIFNNGDEQDHFNIHITRKLGEEELHEFAKIVKQHNYQNIIVDFYEPSYYRKMLEILKKENLPEDIQYTFLGNPLYDDASCFEGLDNIVENNINIHYNTCNDLNTMTRGEPHTEGARYYSDIEASGFTDSENYHDMVKMLDEVVEHMEEKEYSPLEKISYLHDYFKKNFIYDPDYQTTEHSENAHLDKVFRKDRMICEGFSNLYSAVLRRAGLLCFTYGTDDHQKNIVRITDPKYGVDQLAIIDPTFDLSAENNHNVFDNFLVPIDNDMYAHQVGAYGEIIPTPEVINIPTSLSMATEYYNTYIQDSNPVYATNPIGYAIRMLELMGLGTPDAPMTTTERAEYLKSALTRTNLTKKIPYNVIAQAIHRVREKEQDYRDEYESTIDQEEMIESLANRGYKHDVDPQIKLFDGTNIRVESYHPSLEVDFIPRKAQPMIYTRPRKRQENESNEEFSRYLENFYDTMFYRRYEETMDMNKSEQELEEFEIVEKEREEIPEIVIYRDMDDQSRTFVTADVLRRFRIDEPEYKITLDERTIIYEIKPQEAAYIVDHANNQYAPYTIRFQNFDFNNELNDTMKEEPPENQEKAPDEILIFRDVEDSGRAFVTRDTLRRFQITTPGSKVFLGHMIVYEIDPVQAINIISNCNNPYAPYMIRYVSIEFDKPQVKEEPKEEPKEKPRDEIIIYRDIEDSGRAFVSKSVLNRFQIPVPASKVLLENMIVYEINPADAIAIVDNCNNEYAPYNIRYMAIQFDPIQKEEEKPKEESHEEPPVEKTEELEEDDNLIPGTNYRKPRVRRPYETDDHYVAYLEGYYDSIFGNEEDLFNPRKEEIPVSDNLIPGTNYEKPRVRGNYETDEEYVDYLRDYYNSIFGTEENHLPEKNNVIVPRQRRDGESEESYLEYLAMFYGTPVTEEETAGKAK